MMVNIVNSTNNGTWKSEHLRGDLLTGAAKLSDFGSAVSAEDRQTVLDRQDAIMNEGFKVWAGPVIGQDGTVLVEEGDVMTLNETEKMDFLVQGVKGRLK
jgi:basic membrane lipoprotein Med (substrate-binding protein (PBP1-ABC) superfamily)